MLSLKKEKERKKVKKVEGKKRKKISDYQGLGMQLQKVPRRAPNVLFLDWCRVHELTQTITLGRTQRPQTKTHITVET